MGIRGKTLVKAVIALFLISLIVLNIKPVLADDLSDQINAKKQAMNDVSQQINDLKNVLAQKEKDISSLKSQIDAMNSQIELVQLQIKSSQLEIDKTNTEIEKNENDIKDKEAEIAKQKDLINSVIKELYEEKDTNLLAVVIGSTNFSDMVDKAEYLAKIQSSLKDGLDKLQVLKQELEDKSNQLNAQKTQLEDLKKQKEDEDKTLEDQKYSQAKVMEMTRGQESEYQSKLAQANAEEQSVSAEITALVQEQARRNRANSVTGRDGRGAPAMTGGFSYPLSGINRISVTGGDFMDKAYGFGFPHTGVDLAAAQGTPVMAAGPGSIVIAYDSGGPGLSYVAIDHGNGLVSKYLHLSAIYVKTGDVVNAGDVIGLSGGTPGSHGAGAFTTGAHLHFEIDDYNGNPINPHNYLNIAPPLF